MTVTEGHLDSGLDVRPTSLHLVTPGLAAEVAAPAHDALSAQARRRLLDERPNSFLHVYEDEATSRADQTTGVARLAELRRDGVFTPLPEPTFALYELRSGEHRQLGVVADVPVAGYDRGQVRPHEATQHDKELELARTLDTLGMSSSPVCLGYDTTARLDTLVRHAAAGQPTLAFTATDGVEHTVWVVTDARLRAQLRAELAAVGALYIIDGHHRCAAASRHASASKRESGDGSTRDSFLAVLFPFTQLRLSTYHRLVPRPATSATDLVARLRADFEVEALTAGPAEAARPSRQHDFGLLLDGAWHRLRLRPAATPADLPEALDASLLQALVLGPLFGVTDPRGDQHLVNVPATLDLDALAARCAARDELAFVLHPVSLSQLRIVADGHTVMPPKTTYVEPKAGAGVFLRLH